MITSRSHKQVKSYATRYFDK
ncbi:hypothetical protein ACHAW6_007984, partial [Cyclotella cf. meneghiniana]